MNLKVTEATFLRELNGCIKDLKKEIKVSDINSNVKDIDKNDMALHILKDEIWRESQVEGFENVLREFGEFKEGEHKIEQEHFLNDLELSLKLNIIRHNNNIDAAFTLDNNDTQFLKLREQGYKSSYKFALDMIELMERENA